MTSPSPICTWDGSFTPQDTAAGSHTIALANPAGANYWALTCTQSDDQNSASTANGTIVVNQTNKTATASILNAGNGAAYIFTSQVGIAGLGLDQNNRYQPSYTTTFKVNILTTGGERVWCVGEQLEQSAAYGNIVEVNAIIRAGGGGGGGTTFDSVSVATDSDLTLTNNTNNLFAVLKGLTANRNCFLPTSPAVGQRAKVKDYDGSLASHNITINAGSFAIDGGASTLVMTNTYYGPKGCAILEFISNALGWGIVG